MGKFANYHRYHYYHCTPVSAICTRISHIDQDAACSFSESIFVKSITRLCLYRQVRAAHGHQVSLVHVTILDIDKAHHFLKPLFSNLQFCFVFFVKSFRHPRLWPQTKSKIFRPTILQSEITLVFLESPKTPDVSMWNHSSFHQQYVLSESLRALLFLEGGCGQMSLPSFFPDSLPPGHVFSSCSAVWSKHARKHEVSTAPRSEATFPETFLDKTETQSANRHMKLSRKNADGEFALRLLFFSKSHLNVNPYIWMCVWMSLCWTSRIETINSNCFCVFFLPKTHMIRWCCVLVIKPVSRLSAHLKKKWKHENPLQFQIHFPFTHYILDQFIWFEKVTFSKAMSQWMWTFVLIDAFMCCQVLFWHWSFTPEIVPDTVRGLSELVIMAVSLLHLVHAISLVTFIKLALGRNALGVGWSREVLSLSVFYPLVSDPKQRQKPTFRRTKLQQSRQHQRLWAAGLGQLVIAGSQQQASKAGQCTEVVLMFAWCQLVTPFKKHVKQFCRLLSLLMQLSRPELIKCSLSFPSDTPRPDPFHSLVPPPWFLYNRRGRCIRRAPSRRR